MIFLKTNFWNKSKIDLITTCISQEETINHLNMKLQQLKKEKGKLINHIEYLEDNITYDDEPNYIYEI